VPEVDFMVLCEHVRADGGVLHMLGAGLDKIGIPVVPSGCNMGIALRLKLTRNECDRPHQAEIIFQNEDGAASARLAATVQIGYPDDVPKGWPAYAVLPINMGVPIPAHGIYSVELLVDGESKKSISFIVEKPPPPVIAGA
jgi:hypothetical protein